MTASHATNGATPAAAPDTLPGAPAIAVRALSHRYEASQGELLALDGVELEVGAGEFVSLVGPSGCGKTTLLRLVAGLIEPGGGPGAGAGGAIRVFGDSPRAARESRALGLVSQDPGLLPWRTVAANVRLALEVIGARGGRDEAVRALLERVGIAPFARYYPRQLSGGMRQRVALARALAHGPRLLLMDEPFGALDELSREAMRLELLELWEAERIAVLFVTHSIREAVLLSDRVAVMSPRPGRIVADFPIDLPRPRSDALEETPAFVEQVARVRAVLRAASARAAGAGTVR